MIRVKDRREEARKVGRMEVEVRGGQEGNKKGASEEALETNLHVLAPLTPVCVFVFVLCEQMNLSGSDKVVIKNGISGSRFVVSSSETRRRLQGEEGRKEDEKRGGTVCRKKVQRKKQRRKSGKEAIGQKGMALGRKEGGRTKKKASKEKEGNGIEKKFKRKENKRKETRMYLRK